MQTVKKFADIHFTAEDIERIESGETLIFSISSIVCEVRKKE